MTMADEHAEEPENLDDPPSFFPYEADELPDGAQELNRDLVEVTFEHIVVTEAGDERQHFVLLTDGRRHLMIVIGPFEAMAINYGAEGVRTSRPMTHDLIVKGITEMGGKVEKIVIDDLWSGTYFAKIHISRNGEETIIDSRPSDAIAVAVRCDAPIYAIDGIMQD